MPSRFGWREECRSLSLLSRQVFFVHHAYIGFVVFLNGLLCVLAAPDLVAKTRLSHYLLFGLTLFWLSRVFVQIGVYSSDLWKGKRFETTIHFVFLIFLLYLTITFGLAWLNQLG
jgi:hypothetical protein